jgi:phosphoglycerate dehydrogenase-like enzyme
MDRIPRLSAAAAGCQTARDACGTVSLVKPLTVCVLAPADDSSLRLLDPAPAGVRFVLGNRLEDHAAAAPEAEAVCLVFGGRGLLEPVFARAPRLRWVHTGWAGLDGTLFPALVESDVVMTNSRGVFSASLGEFAMAGILFFAKDLRRMLGNQATARWEPYEVEEVRGRTLGILGYGDIGRAVAARGKGLGLRVLALRRDAAASRGDPFVDEVVPPERRLELIARCDYVVLSLPGTPETRGFFGAAEIAAMKPTAVLVNVGRGTTVDEPALVAALTARRIRGAALDVFAEEPLPAEHPLWRLDNVLVSPHTADRTATWRDEAMQLFLENLGRFRRGEPLANRVDKRRGY